MTAPQMFRVWWIPQVPGKPFHFFVDGPEEAAKFLNVLADYDLFQLKHNIKPDYCNAGGLEEYDAEDQEWYEWSDEDTGLDIWHWGEEDA